MGAIRTHLVWREELVVVFIHVHVVAVKLQRDTERRRDEKAVRQRLTRYHRDSKTETFSQSAEMQKQCNKAA